MAISVARLAKIFKALSDQNRFEIVLELKDGEKSGTELLRSMPFSQPTLSHHLAILCESEIIAARRDGKTVMYRINTEAAKEISSVADELSTAVSAPVQKREPVKTVKRAPAPKKTAVEQPAAPQVEKEPEPAPKPVQRRRDDFDFFD